jgi:methylenetetrahydrofolate--tRNA-(uracil-5-)-methyltransferase
MGLLAGRFAAAERLAQPHVPPPRTTALGALIAHITGGADAKTFQPMNINYGLLPELPPPNVKGKERGRAKKQLMSRRALGDVDAWLGRTGEAAAE